MLIYSPDGDLVAPGRPNPLGAGNRDGSSRGEPGFSLPTPSRLRNLRGATFGASFCRKLQIPDLLELCKLKKKKKSARALPSLVSLRSCPGPCCDIAVTSHVPASPGEIGSPPDVIHRRGSRPWVPWGCRAPPGGQTPAPCRPRGREFPLPGCPSPLSRGCSPPSLHPPLPRPGFSRCRDAPKALGGALGAAGGARLVLQRLPGRPGTIPGWR